jgi:hypothetical protein
MKEILRVTPEATLLEGLTATVEWFRKESEGKPALTSAAMETK